MIIGTKHFHQNVYKKQLKFIHTYPDKFKETKKHL